MRPMHGVRIALVSVALAGVHCSGGGAALDAGAHDVAASPPDARATLDAATSDGAADASPPAVVFNADGIAVTALVVTPTRATPRSTVSVAYTVATNRRVVFAELTAAVRDAADVDDAHLDFAHHAAVTLDGTQAFNDSTTPGYANTFRVHVAYTLDGTTWVHLDAPVATFVLADAPADGGTITDSAVPADGAVATTNPLGSVGARSGLGWNSGVFPVDRTGSPASYLTEFEVPEMRRGRLCDIEQAGQWSDTWADVTGIGVLGLMNTLAVSVVDMPPFPTGGSWAAAASGAYDAYYQQIGARVVTARPSRPTVLRLAWEFNGNWFPHHADGSFVAGWQRAVSQIRMGAGAHEDLVKVSWSVAALDTSAGYDPLTQLWPGDAYVDFIGIDVYDAPASTATHFVYGPTLDTVDAFAHAHGKMLAIEEWGLHHVGNLSDGGDNPAFIHAMYAWIHAHTADLVYEQYFQDDSPTNVNSSLFSPDVDHNPNGRAAYLAELH